MFDIGFWEVAFIGVIALLIIGPERLPGAAHRVGLWVGKGRRMLNEVMADVKKEMKEYEVEQVSTLKDEFKSAKKQLNEVTQSTSDALDLQAVGNEVKNAVAPSTAAPSAHKTGKTTKKSTTLKPTRKTASKKPAARKKTKPTTIKKTAKKTSKKKAAKRADESSQLQKSNPKKSNPKKSSPKKAVQKKQ